MTILVLIGILIAEKYYGNINASEDPKVINTKHLYKKYNVFVENNDYKGLKFRTSFKWLNVNVI